MTKQRAALIGLLEPQQEQEDEFHAWYETEHIPSRLGVPGFLTGRRFVCVEGWPKYIVIYDLESPDVLTSAPYLAITGVNHTPWSKRMVAGFRGYARAVMVQLAPGPALTGQKGPCTRLLYMRFKTTLESAGEQIEKGLRTLFDGKRETVQFRLFRGHNDPSLYIAIVELRKSIQTADIDISQFADAGSHIELMNLYAPWFAQA